MARNEKQTQTTTPVETNQKKKYKATAPQSAASFLECEIDGKKDTIGHGEILALTEQEKNRLSASCTWNFEEVK